jgi:hypothetical protein
MNSRKFGKDLRSVSFAWKACKGFLGMESLIQ